ncbi:MAG: hypothetical protein EPN84_00305 [Legionella sp.]|nr:MAG: hypothetical protein EPN84_00305 [Legionella sp.]
MGESNIYILPTGFGLAFGVLLLSLLIGAVNYQISIVFLMTFLLAVIGLVSAWEAHANLKELSIKLISIEDAEQGKAVQVRLLIEPNRKVRFGLEFQFVQEGNTRLEKIAHEGMQFIVPIDTIERGYFALPRLTISSIFPFGLFRVWAYAYFEEHYYVYPAALSPGFWPVPTANSQFNKNDLAGDEEFYDLKQVDNPWAQPNLIAWKIAAKDQGWYLKTRENEQGDYWLFKLEDSPEMKVDNQLQNLSFWLQGAEENHAIYGLKLPNILTPLTQGEDHLKHCLRQLALYNE